MAASLIIAVLLWIHVAQTQRTTKTVTFVSVPVNFVGEKDLRDGKGLVVYNISTRTVSLTLSGYVGDLAELDESQISATIDLRTTSTTGYKQIAYSVAYPSGFDSRGITVTGRTPQNITFSVGKLTTARIGIVGEFNGNVAQDYLAGPITITPDGVRVTGPEEEIDKIARGLVTVSREDADRTINTDREFTLVDDSGNTLNTDALELETEIVNFNMPILMTVKLPLRIDYVEGGGATAGHVRASFEDGKETIIIAGDPEVMGTLNYISLSPSLSLASFASTTEAVFTVQLPNDVENISGFTEVEVIFEVAGLSTKKFTVTNIDCVNVQSGFAAMPVTESLEVTVRAPQAVLDVIVPGAIRAQIDLTDFKTIGNTTHRVAILLDGYPEAGAIFEYNAVVSLRVVEE